MKSKKSLLLVLFFNFFFFIGSAQIVVTFSGAEPGPPVDCLDIWEENGVTMQMVEVMGGGSCFFDYDGGGDLWLFPSGFEMTLNDLPPISSVTITATDYCGNGCTSGEITSGGSPVFSFGNTLIGDPEVFVFDNVANLPLDILFIQSFEGQINEVFLQLDIDDCLEDTDSDGDGVCDELDCAPFDPAVYPGGPCFSGDVCIEDETYDDNCDCSGGTPIIDCSNECILSEGELIGSPCEDGDPCTEGEIWSEDCLCLGGEFQDADGDGVCDYEDFCPELDDNLLGMPCDDGDPCTVDDYYDIEYCDCIGFYIGDGEGGEVDCNDCVASGGELIGEPCDDFDPCTEGETYDEDCNCTGGVYLDSDEDGVCDFFDQCPEFDDNLIGMPCDDGDPCTEGEVYNSICLCGGGISIDNDDDGYCGEEDPDDNDPCNPDDSAPECQPVIECIVLEDMKFEMGYGSWIDGGSDAAVGPFTAFAYSGVNCLRLRDNTSSSTLTSASYDLSDAVEAKVEFTYITDAFDLETEDFLLEMSIDGGITFSQVEEWNLGDEIVDGVRAFPSVDIPGPFSADTKFRFRCDAHSNADKVYIDDIVITKCIEVDPPSCSDGIQNGDETGIDCGGSCAPCPPVLCTDFIVEDFESGWGIWNDGGSDARRSSIDAPFADSGVRCIRLRDNTETSVITTDDLDYTNVAFVEITFSYIVESFDSPIEDFWLQYSTDGGATFTTVEEWNLGDEITNDLRQVDFVSIPGPFTANTQLRFRCDATANSDRVYIDDIAIATCEEAEAEANVYVQTTGFFTQVSDYYLDNTSADVVTGSITAAALADRNYLFLPLPESSYSAAEEAALVDFLAGGGRIIAIGCPCVGGSIPVVNALLSDLGSTMSLDNVTLYGGCTSLSPLTNTDNDIANGITEMGGGCLTTVNAGAGSVKATLPDGDIIAMESVGGGEIVVLGDVDYFYSCATFNNLFLAFGLINQPVELPTDIIGEITEESLQLETESASDLRSEKSYHTTLEVYPNPISTGEELFIEVSNPENVLSYQVLDMNGKMYNSANWISGANSMSINIDNLSQGYYFVKLNTLNSVETKKFLVF